MRGTLRGQLARMFYLSDLKLSIPSRGKLGNLPKPLKDLLLVKKVTHTSDKTRHTPYPIPAFARWTLGPKDQLYLLSWEVCGLRRGVKASRFPQIFKFARHPRQQSSTTTWLLLTRSPRYQKLKRPWGTPRHVLRQMTLSIQSGQSRKRSGSETNWIGTLSHWWRCFTFCVFSTGRIPIYCTSLGLCWYQTERISEMPEFRVWRKTSTSIGDIDSTGRSRYSIFLIYCTLTTLLITCLTSSRIEVPSNVMFKRFGIKRYRKTSRLARDQLG